MSNTDEPTQHMIVKWDGLLPSRLPVCHATLFLLPSNLQMMNSSKVHSSAVSVLPSLECNESVDVLGCEGSTRGKRDTFF